MSTAVSTFMGGLVRPAHLQDAFAEIGNIKERTSIPTLSIAGKKFTMSVNGDSTILTKQEGGETVNLQFINVVVVAMNPKRSRTFYAKGYVSGENQAPACHSVDGVRPDKSSKTPQAATCAACPKSVKGSKISDNGIESYACNTLKRLAIWPEAMLRKPELDIPVMRLNLPITSVWDKNNKENDAAMWFAWDNYVDDLRARGVKHTGEVITRIKFDNTEHPKLLFKAVRWLDDAEHIQFNELAAIKGVMGTDEVQQLIFGIPEAPAEEASPEVAAPVTQVASKPEIEVEDDGFSSPPAPPAVTPPGAKAVKPPKAPKSASPAPVASVTSTGASPENLRILLEEWDQ